MCARIGAYILKKIYDPGSVFNEERENVTDEKLPQGQDPTLA